MTSVKNDTAVLADVTVQHRPQVSILGVSGGTGRDGTELCRHIGWGQPSKRRMGDGIPWNHEKQPSTCRTLFHGITI
jgi:hypothetical protein